MGAKERLEQMDRLIEQRLSRGEVLLTPEQIQAQENARYADGNSVKWGQKRGEFQPARNHKLKHTIAAPPKRDLLDDTKLRYKKKRRELGHWNKLKAAVLKERGTNCEHCQQPNSKPILSRKNWKRKGRELAEDVELLCQVCFDNKYPHKVHDPLTEEYRKIVG
jgi:5-methylcytosine-specific restriction endonuclease McrA